MDIFTAVDCLYTRKDFKWIDEINEEELGQLQPYVIQRLLVKDNNLRVQVRWLDKYVYWLPTKMFLSLAHTILPKYSKRPFIPHEKKDEEQEDPYEFILKLIRKQMVLSDNDYRIVKDRLKDAIMRDKVNWFAYYGIPKRYWKQFGINFEEIKKFGVTQTINPQKGLNAWGL